jgi:hypothetical protein
MDAPDRPLPAITQSAPDTLTTRQIKTLCVGKGFVKRYFAV